MAMSGYSKGKKILMDFILRWTAACKQVSANPEVYI